MKVLDAMPQSTRARGGASERYPYNDWLNGDVNFLEPGVDFNCKLASIESSVRNAAKKRGLKVRCVPTVHDGVEGLAVQLKQESNQEETTF